MSTERSEILRFGTYEVDLRGGVTQAGSAHQAAGALVPVNHSTFNLL